MECARNTNLLSDFSSESLPTWDLSSSLNSALVINLCEYPITVLSNFHWNIFSLATVRSTK